MALIEVKINTKHYQISCETGERAKIKKYASLLSKKIAEFEEENPMFFIGLNDERIFLFQCLAYLEEVDKLSKQIKLLKKEMKKQTKEKNFQNKTESLQFFKQLEGKIDQIQKTLDKF